MDSPEKSVCPSCNSGSWRRTSIKLSRDGSGYFLEDVPDECLAQIGDCGPSDESGRNSSSFEIPRKDTFRKISRGASLRSSGGASEKLEDNRIQEELETAVVHDGEYGHWNDVSPLPTDVILHAGENANSRSVSQKSHVSFSKVKEDRLPGLLDYLSYLVHLGVFGVLGVLTRYLLKKLFGPDVLSLTNSETPLYPDLLANVVGSFFMGWFGVVFKEDVRYISDHLAVGLTTGYLGSLTTFSGWIQNMVRLSSKGQWIFAVSGIVIGMWVVDRSIDTGVWTAGCFRRYLVKKLKRDPDIGKVTPENWRVDRLKRHGVMMALMIVILCGLWGLSGAFAKTLVDDLSTGSEIWLAFLVGPPGVWSRWYLARLNGQGIGKKGSFKWLPVGTLMANFLAACMMAALSTIANAVNTERCEIIVGGIQLGFMGCLSTVSTFALEVYAMRQGDRGGRALAYVAVTFISSFGFGTLIYSVPVWTKHYH